MTAALSPAQPGGLDVPDLRLEVPPGATAAGAAARRGGSADRRRSENPAPALRGAEAP